MATIVNLGYNELLSIDLMHSLFGIGEYQDSQLLDFFDFLSNTIMKPKTRINEIKQSSKFTGEKLFVVMIKYIAPVFVVVILVAYVMNTMGMISL